MINVVKYLLHFFQPSDVIICLNIEFERLCRSLRSTIIRQFMYLKSRSLKEGTKTLESILS